LNYVYAITGAHEKTIFGNFGLDELPVYSIPFKNLSAAATILPDSRSITLEDARVHENALRSLMAEGPIIPMTFGFILEDENTIRDLLEQGYDVFEDSLRRLTGKIQLDMKISWDKRVMIDVQHEEKIRKLVLEVKKAPDDKLLKVELGRTVKEALDERGKNLLTELQHIDELADEKKENPTRDIDSIVHTSFLLDKGKLKPFLDEVDRLEKKFEGTSQIKVVFPLPPYIFVGIRVEKADFKKLEESRIKLELDTEITPIEIENAFNKLARIHHPDVNRGDSNAFREVRKAYETLNDFYKNYSGPLRQEAIENKLIFRAC